MRPMIVGFMRNFRKPSYLAKLVAVVSKYQGIELIYLRPSDVNVKKGTVNGRMFIDNSWVSVEVPLPKFIDISPYCFKQKNRKIIEYLRKNTILSDNRIVRMNKEELQNELKKDKQFSHLVIPTIKVHNFNDIESFLEKYNKVVLKPISGQFGVGIYVLKKKGDSYILVHQDKETEISHTELISFFDERIKSKSYILQRYIASKSLQGHPFDCRINVEKNGEGKWVIAKKFIRIGIGQRIVSNISQGGGVSRTKPFLKANYGTKWREIEDNLNKIAETLPYKIEKLRKTKLMTLGIDIGIDTDGRLYLFETNSAPGTTQLRSEAALLRSQYYRYVLENRVSKEQHKSYNAKIKRLEQANKELGKQNQQYQKKIDSIEKRAVWKIVKLLDKMQILK